MTTVTSDYHDPVLLAESLDHLDLHAGAIVVDGTLGGGGHAASILERTRPDGRLIGLDLDSDALAEAGRRLEADAERITLVRASFRRLDDVVRATGLSHVDAVLLDLGVSSHQLDVSARGFRFSGEDPETTPLDMRLAGESDTRTAADWLRESSVAELQSLFERYGELPGSRRLAERIVAERAERPLATAADLIRVVKAAKIGRGRRHNPATLVFQALRIAVNDELGALEEGLEAAIDVLRPGGRLVVIAYHSLEDRIVKQRFRSEAKGCTCPPKLPVCVCGGRVRLRVITRKPVVPREDEIACNPRARSARLRAAERIGSEERSAEGSAA